MMPQILCGKRYHTLDRFYKERFGEKVAKVSLNCGFTCPNRDGTRAYGGCIYCSPTFSGDFAGKPALSVTEQFHQITQQCATKWKATKFIPYFQAGTNTYAPLARLKELFEEALSLENVVGLSIATRPDCIANDVLEYLSELNKRTFLIIELGLQTIHDSTATLINRQTTFMEFLNCYNRLSEKNIAVCVHLINGLPGETRDMMMQSVKKVASLRPQSIKLHLLHILEGTEAAKLYATGEFRCLTKEEYIALICDQLQAIPYDTVIARLTGDGNRNRLIAPLWSMRKREVLGGIDQEMQRRGAVQGDQYGEERT